MFYRWQSFRQSRVAARNVAAVLAASLLISVSAWVRIPLPFSPVPVTAQTLAILLVGVILGPRHGSWAVLTYLLQGLVGLPVFAGGASGAAVLLGPTGGYLLGFVAAAYVTGWLHQRGYGALALIGGNLVIYLLGVSWLALGVGPTAALSLGFLPFIPGDLIKLGCAALLLRTPIADRS
jgi:biotin transport system substrate-specific component